MKFLYVDAENVGISVLKEEITLALDRVFFFTNSESIKETYANPLITFISGYPTGKNQADFHIIGHLASVLSHISKQDKKTIEFVLCSKDVSLWKAFQFQCSLARVKSSSSHIDIETVTDKAIIKQNGSTAANAPPKPKDVEKAILKLLARPATVVELKETIGLSNSVFQAAFNKLVVTGKIKRQEGAKLNWCLTE